MIVPAHLNAVFIHPLTILTDVITFRADANLEDSEQERQRSAEEVEDLQQQLSKAAADAWMKAAE